MMDSEPEYHKRDYSFNFYPACSTSKNTQPGNCDLTHSAQQNTLSNHTGGAKHTTHHPRTQQYTPKYPGKNQHFSLHPGTNPFSTQEIGTPHLAQYPGANQHSTQHPGVTQYFAPQLGQYQFGRTTHYTGAEKFPGPPLYTPYLGTAQYSATSKQFVGRMPYDTGSKFRQTATQFSEGKECTTGNPSGQLLGNIGVSIIGNLNSKVFGNTGAQPQNFNSYQFTSPNVEENQPEGPQNNLPEKQKQKPLLANREFFKQDSKTADKLEPKREQNQLTEEKEAQESAHKEKERIDKSIGIKHLITSYAKARTLVSLCRDFNTPLFGDLPSNEEEKIVVKNLAHFLKDETNKIEFVCSSVEQEITTIENEDPTMQAGLSLIAATISELEKKKRKLEGDKREFENVDKIVKGFTGELEENIKQATTLKTEVEAHNVRLERLKERQKNERKSNESERSKFNKEMEEINKLHVHSLQENLRTLQEKIEEETKGFNDAKKELKNLKERNDSLRTRIKEVETTNSNLKKILAKSIDKDGQHPRSEDNLSVRMHLTLSDEKTYRVKESH